MLLSIVIPCFNAARYLSRTLDSIFKQNFNNFEIILVDDGSTDDTRLIVNRYIENHSCICYLYQENQGVAVARNTGLINAKGNYICFVDADDTLEDNYFKEIESELSDYNENLDLILFGFNYYKKDNKRLLCLPSRNKHNIIYDYMTYRGRIAVYSIVYNRALLLENSVSFTPGAAYSEDIEFFVKAIFYANVDKIKFIKKALYNYLYNENSAMRLLVYNDKKFTSVETWMRIYGFLCGRGVSRKLKNATYNRLVYTYLCHYLLCKKTCVEKLDLFRKYDFLTRDKLPFSFSPFYFCNLFYLYIKRI